MPDLAWSQRTAPPGAWTRIDLQRAMGLRDRNTVMRHIRRSGVEPEWRTLRFPRPHPRGGKYWVARSYYILSEEQAMQVMAYWRRIARPRKRAAAPASDPPAASQ